MPVTWDFRRSKRALRPLPFPPWREDNYSFALCVGMPPDRSLVLPLMPQHQLFENRAKKTWSLAPEAFTIGFCSTEPGYNTADLIFLT